MVTLKRRNLVALAVILLVSTVVLSSFVFFYSQKNYSGKIESVTLGILPNETSSLIYVAQNQKYFADNGLNIIFKDYASGAAATQGMLNGTVNLAVAAEFVLAEEALANASLCTFASIGKFQTFYMIARTDQGINKILDLNGQKIGVAFGTIGEFYLGRFLDLNGVDQSNLTLVNVPLPEAQNALENGSVNAVVTLQPYVNEIESSMGNKVVEWQVQSNQLAYVDLICTNSWAQQNPDLIVRFLKSMVQAQNYLLSHQTQSITIINKALNYSSSYLPTVWSDYQFSVSLDQAQILALQDEAQWLMTNNLTEANSMPNFLNYIYFNGLMIADPEAITIIH
jgi:NitT/TauT family transport system substrate-binding protein